MKTFVISDESLNEYGFWLPTSGAMLEQFKKNPIMLWMHNRPWRGTDDEVLPPGRWDNITIDNKKRILADAVFDEEDEFALRLSSKVEGGFLRMASAGIKVIETSSDPKWLKPGQTRETPIKWVLKEVSLVDFGANNNALAIALYDENDQLIELSSGEIPENFPLKKLSATTGTQTTNTIKNMKKLAIRLNLAETSSEEAIDAAIVDLQQQLRASVDKNKQLETELATLKQEQTEARTKEAKELLDIAVKDGRLNAASRPAWEKLFAVDHDSAKASLADIPVRKSAKELIEGEGETGKKEREELAKLSWDELDKAGKLPSLKTKHYDLYEEKFEARFGKKPAKA